MSKIMDYVALAVEAGLRLLLSRKEDLGIVAQRAMVESRTLLADLDHIDKWEQEQLDRAVPKE